MAVVKNLMVRIGADTSGIVKGMKDAWKSTWVSSDKIKQATTSSSKAVADVCKSAGASMRAYTAQVKKLKVDHAAAMDGVKVYGDELKRLKDTYGTIKNATDGLDLSKSLTEQLREAESGYIRALKSARDYGEELGFLKATYDSIKDAIDGLDLGKSLEEELGAAAKDLDRFQAKIKTIKQKLSSNISKSRATQLSKELRLLQEYARLTEERFYALNEAAGKVGDKNIGMASATGLKKLAAEISTTEANLKTAYKTAEENSDLFRALSTAAENVGAENMGMASAAELKKLAAEISTTEARLKAMQEVAGKTGEKLKHIGGDTAIAGLKRIGSAAAAATKAGVKGLGKSLGNLAKDSVKGLASIPGKLLRIGKSARTGNGGVVQMLSSIKRMGAVSLGLKVASSLFGRLRSVVSSYVSQNEALNSTVTQLKDQLGQALAPAINIVISAVQTLMPLVQRVSGMISSVMTAIGGKLVAATAAIKETADEAAEASDGLYGFDQITKESDDSSSSSTSSASVVDVAAPAGLLSWVDELKNAIKARDWKGIGSVIAQGLNSCVKAIKWPDIKRKVLKWIHGITDGIHGFSTQIDFGTLGEKIGGGLNVAISSVSQFIRDIDWATIANGIGAGITSFFANIDWSVCKDLALNGLNSVLESISGFTSGFAPLQGIDFSATNASLQGLLASVLSLAEVIGTSLADAYDRVLKPLLGWTIDSAVPAAVDMLSEAFSMLGTFVAPVIDGISGFMTAIEPVTSFIGSIAIDCFNLLKSTFAKLGEVFTQNGGEISNIVTGIGEVIRIVWKAIEPQLTAVKATVGALLGYIRDVVVNAFRKIISVLSGVIDFVVGVFTLDFKRAFGGIANIFKSTLDGMKNSVNAVVKLINGLISGVCDGINVIIKGINKISLDIPSWVPGIGGKTLGFNIEPITAPQIPMLKKGTIVTKPTVAMFGEKGAEAVVPLENNTGWIRKVATELDASRSGGESGKGLVITIPIYIGGRKITEQVIKDIKDITKTTGKNPVMA